MMSGIMQGLKLAGLFLELFLRRQIIKLEKDVKRREKKEKAVEDAKQELKKKGADMDDGKLMDAFDRVRRLR